MNENVIIVGVYVIVVLTIVIWLYFRDRKR